MGTVGIYLFEQQASYCSEAQSYIPVFVSATLIMTAAK